MERKKKLSCFADDIYYIKKMLNVLSKLLELVNEFSKFVGYKVDIPKAVFFLYTNNVQLELKNTTFKMA